MELIRNLIDTSGIQRIKFRGDVNGLRALAVLSVVFYHAEVGPFKGGWVGVDIFFVISGYLISNIIISELNQGKFSFKNFYLRRIYRILPALFSMLIFTLPFAYWFLTPRALLEYTNSLISSVFFYSNYYFQNLDFYNASSTKVMPLLHTWSLSIEEQFYLIFPMVCFVLFKYFKKYFSILILIFFFASLFLNSTTNELIKFYQFQFRAWELLLGALVMILQPKFEIKHIEKLGIGLIIFSIFYFDDSMLTLNSVEPRLLANIGVASILFSKSKGTVSAILENKIFNFFGLISYSLYLFHQPLFAFARLAEKKIDGYTISFPALFILLTLASYLNWKFVEIGIKKLKIKKLLLIFLFLMFAILLFVLFSNSTEGFVDRFDYIPDDVLYYSNNPNIYPQNYPNEYYIYKNVDCNLKLLEFNYCKWSYKEVEKTIYLIGDSQTNSLSVSFLSELDLLKNDYNLVFFSGRSGRCLLSKQSDTVGDVEECNEIFFNEFLNLLDKNNDIVVAFGRYNTWLTEKGVIEIKCSNCNHIEVFKNRLSMISKSSKKLYIIDTIPTFSFSVADSYLYKKILWGEPVVLELASWGKNIQNTNKFFESLDLVNMEIIQTLPLYCDVIDKKICFGARNNVLIYSDGTHLTLKGANPITKAVEEKIYKDFIE